MPRCHIGGGGGLEQSVHRHAAMQRGLYRRALCGVQRWLLSAAGQMLLLRFLCRPIFDHRNNARNWCLRDDPPVCRSGVNAGHSTSGGHSDLCVVARSGGCRCPGSATFALLWRTVACGDDVSELQFVPIASCSAPPRRSLVPASLQICLLISVRRRCLSVCCLIRS
jgi:hypothetical protein